MHQLPNHQETIAIVAVFAFLIGLAIGIFGSNGDLSPLFSLVGAITILLVLIAVAADSASLGMFSLAGGIPAIFGMLLGSDMGPR